MKHSNNKNKNSNVQNDTDSKIVQKKDIGLTNI
jgi:hypothetical protein